MKPKYSVFALLAGIPILATVHAQTSTWSAAAGGSWSTPENWNPAVVPTSADAVVFNPSVDTPVTLGADQVAASLSASSAASSTGNANRVALTGGGTNRALVVSGATTVAGNVNFVVGSTTAGQNVNLTTTSITKSGTGTLELGNANTIGNILLEQGNFFGRNAGAFGSATSGTITLGAASGSASVNLRMATAVYVAKPVVLGGTTGLLTIDTLGASSPTFTGGVTGSNNLRISSSNAGVMTVNTGVIDNTGTLNVANLGNTALGTIHLNAAIGSNVTAVTFSNTNTVAGSLINLNNTANAYSGSTTIAANANVRLGNSEVIPNGAGKGDVTISGTLDLRIATGNSTETLNGLSGPATGLIKRTGASGTSTLILGGNDASGTFDGTFNQGPGVIAITKIGAGELTLSAATNGHTGATTVSGGTLTLKDLNFIPSAGMVSIAAGATLHLDYSGSNTVASLRLGGIAQASGKWGRTGSIATLGAAFETSSITGDGLLEVTNTAGDVYWDGTGSSWTSAASWSVDPANPTPNPAVPPDANFSTIFGITGLAAAQTVNLNGNRETSGMRFVSPATFTFQGGGAARNLTLSGGGITVNADATAPVIGSSTAIEAVNLTLAEAQIWTNLAVGQSVVVHNFVGGSAVPLTLAGAGGFTLNGPWDGVSSLTVSATEGASFNGPVSGTETLSVSTTATFNGVVSGTAPLRKMGAGTAAFTGADTFTGDKTLDRGTVNVGGDQTAATGAWLLRGYSDTGTTYGTAATTLNIATGAKLAIDSGKSVQAGNSAPSGGFLAQTINSAGTVTNHGTLLLGRVGTLNVTGGAWTQNGNATVATQGGGLATLRVNAGAAFTYSSGTEFLLNTSTSNNTVANLIVDGGTFTTGVAIHNNTAALSPLDSAFATVTLTNGGTFKLSANVTDLFTTSGANRSFVLGTGIGVVDTNGFSTELNVPVTGTGGLTKAGSGTLTTTAINTYAGDTVVAGGTLSVAGPNLADTAAVTIANGAKLKLSFTGEDTIAGLTVGINALGEGTYNAVSHPLFIEGDGKLVVVPVTPTFANWAADLGLSGDPEADFDQDGIKDALEFVLGTDPKAASNSTITTQNVGDDFIFTFTRDDRSETTDLTLFVEAGGTLQAWPQVFEIKDITANSTAGVAITENADAADTVTVTIPKNGAERIFARIKVVVSGS